MRQAKGRSPLLSGNVDLVPVPAGSADAGLVSDAPETSLPPIGTDEGRFYDREPVVTMVGGAPQERWLRAISAWHQAGRLPVPIILDSLVAGAITGGLTRSYRGGLIGAVAFAVTGLLFGLWQLRSTMETQGVWWYTRHLIPAAWVATIAVRESLRGIGDYETAEMIAGIIVVLSLVRFALWQMVGMLRRQGLGLKPTLVVGAEDRIAQVRHRMDVFPEAGLRFKAGHVPKPLEGSSVGAGQELVEGLLDRHSVEHVMFVADDMEEDVFKDFLRFAPPDLEMSVLVPLARVAAQTRAHLGDLGTLPIRIRPSWGSNAAKRGLDIVGSILGLLVFGPVIAIAALATRAETPGPLIFKQRRVGREGQEFMIYKLRSMVDGAEKMSGARISAELSADLGLDASEATHDDLHRSLPIESYSKLTNAMREGDPRVTKVGSLLRHTAIDELPQLFNVLKGQMSLVGPRPLPVNPCQFDTVAQIRHRVRPGMTGPWQTYGSSALPYPDMIDLDLTYVATHSLGDDLRMLARTPPALLVRRAPA